MQYAWGAPRPLLKFCSGGVRRCSRAEMLRRSLGSVLACGHVKGRRPAWPTTPSTVWCSRVSSREEVQRGNRGWKGLAPHLQAVSPALLASSLAIQMEICILFPASFALDLVVTVLSVASGMQEWGWCWGCVCTWHLCSGALTAWHPFLESDKSSRMIRRSLLLADNI